jgi:hypothetical protein
MGDVTGGVCMGLLRCALRAASPVNAFMSACVTGQHTQGLIIELVVVDIDTCTYMYPTTMFEGAHK